MDLLKTLLIYMMMSTAGAALEAGVTPIPYDSLHTPTPVVTPTQAPTPTPEPTPSPSPTLPPVTLYEGRLGTHVRMLQQLLYDLGYLNTEPDGIYGAMTKEAVKTFQERNNLEDDGIAGPKTIEKLYEPDSVPGPRFDTPTPSPTPTPTPSPTPTPTSTPTPTPSPTPSSTPTPSPTPSSSPSPSPSPTPLMAQVSIRYQTEDGKVLHSLSLRLAQGTRTIRANSALVPAGYELTSEDSVRLTVDENGVASQEAVIFVYRQPSVTADIQIHYVSVGSDGMLVTTTLTLEEGATPVYPASALLPTGYVLLDTAPVEVTVSADGTATPSIITFRIVQE